MKWTEDSLNRLCSTAAMAYLSHAINTTRLQDPLENFDSRLKKLVGGDVSTKEQIDIIRSIIERNIAKCKREVDAEFNYSTSSWQSIVVQVLSDRLKNKLNPDESGLATDSQITLQILSALRQHFVNCSISLSIDTGAGHAFKTYRIPKDAEANIETLNRKMRLDLFAKKIPVSGNFKFKFHPNSDLLTEPELIQVLICFVRQGVSYLMAKISHYEAIATGNTKKCGKWANALGEITGSCLGALIGSLAAGNATGGSKVGGKISQLVIQEIGNSKYHEKSTKIMALFSGYDLNYETTSKYRQIFINAFLELSQIFEFQLVRIRADSVVWESKIKLLSIEIVGRIMNFLSSVDSRPKNSNIFSEDGADRFKNFLVQSAIAGSSKASLLTETIPKCLQFFSTTKRGFEITQELSELTWRSFEIFEKCGIVEEGIYFCLNSSDENRELVARYGFRRLAHFERFDENTGRDKAALFLRTRFEQIDTANQMLEKFKQFDYRLGTSDLSFEYMHDIVLEELIELSSKNLQIETRNVVNETKSTVDEIDVKLDRLCANFESHSTTKPIQYGIDTFSRMTSILFGRDEDVIVVHDSLNRSNSDGSSDICKLISVICGLGGVGKTALAQHFALRFNNEYDGNIFWMNGATLDSIQGSFLGLGESLGLIPNHSPDTKASTAELELDDLVRKIYNVLTDRKYLIVFDNVENETEEDYDGFRFLYKYLPPVQFPSEAAQKHVLITSRLDNWDKGIDVIHLKELSPEASQQFILESCDDISGDAKSVSADALDLGIRLQGLPLALQTAVAYINQVNSELALVDSSFTIGDYLTELNENENVKELLDFKIPKESLKNIYHGSVLTTWLVTTKRIRKVQPEALNILNCVSYMIPDGIPTKWLVGIKGNFNNIISARQLATYVNLLKSYSMISVRIEPNSTISIHRLVQEVNRLTLEKSTELSMAELSLALTNCMDLLERQMVKGQSPSSKTSTVEKLDCISHGECVWNYVMTMSGHNNATCHEIVGKYAPFAFASAKQLFDMDRLYPCLRFCYDMIQNMNRDDFLAPQVVSNDFCGLMLTIQGKLFPDITVQYKWLKVFDYYLGQRTNLRYFRTLLILCNRFLGDWDHGLHNNAITNLVNYLRNPEAYAKSNGLLTMQSLMFQQIPPLVYADVENIDVLDKNYMLTLYRDLYSIIILTLFPLMTYDYCEEDLIAALKLFEYLTEKFRAKLKAYPLLRILILESSSFCWFKLRARPAAIEPLRRCISIWRAIVTNDIGNDGCELEECTNLITTTIKYLRTDSDHSREIELNLRTMIGIVKVYVNTNPSSVNVADMQEQLGRFVQKIFKCTTEAK